MVAAVFLATACSLHAQPVIGGILNGASYSGNIAPGSWASLFGSGLAAATASAPSLPLPRTLGGVTVTVSGIAAPLNYVSPTQINFIVPFEVSAPPAGGAAVATVKVTGPGGTSAAFNMLLSRDAPGIFTRNMSGTGSALIFDAGFHPLNTVGSDAVIFYATGLGPTSPPGSSDSGGSPTEPLNRAVDNVQVFIGDVQADLIFAGLAPGFPGIYQVNVVPNGPMSDRVYIRVGSWQSNMTNVGIQAGSNVANVSGSIEGLYPSTLTMAAPYYVFPLSQPVPATAMLAAGAYSVSFDILPGAKPFDVVAVSEGGRAVIAFNPAAGTYQATSSVPSLAARAGDFSGAEFGTVWDLASYQSGVVTPFPGNVVPTIMLPPTWAQVMKILPAPNSPVAGSATALFTSSGPAAAGSHFVIDFSNHPELATFGGFFQISPDGWVNLTTTFELYVDGQLVASRNAPYSVR